MSRDLKTRSGSPRMRSRHLNNAVRDRIGLVPPRIRVKNRRVLVTIHLIDASPFLFRAFFSLPKTIVDRDGKPANAVYGFGSFFAKYMTDEKPTHIGVAFDRHFNQSFRI